jgi:hypothetical protein
MHVQSLYACILGAQPRAHVFVSVCRYSTLARNRELQHILACVQITHAPVSIHNGGRFYFDALYMALHVPKHELSQTLSMHAH